MKLAVLQENLKRGLATVAPAVATKGQAVLTTVKLVAADGALAITGTNLETAITCRVGAKVAAEGAACIPAKLLEQVVAGLPNDKIELTLGKAGLRLVCEPYEATINGIDADEYPTVPQVALGALQLPVEVVRDISARVALAAATDDTRPVLRGVRLAIDGAWVTACAADGFRLVRQTAELEAHAGERLALLVPARALALAAKALKDAEGPLQLGVSRATGDAMGPISQLVLAADGIAVVTRLIDGQYPDVARVLPATHITRVVVDTAELKRSAQLAQYFANRSAGIVKLQVETGGDLKPGRLTLSANAAEVGDAVAHVDAMVTGPSTPIALNVEFLAAALTCIPTPQVAIELQHDKAPAVFKPVGADDYVHVVMPMTVR